LGKRTTRNFQPFLTEINIISFDVPFPANYGGVIDVFYRIKHFYSKGIKVHLHCFEYGREKQEKLNQYCETVHYYKRRKGAQSHISNLPFIVKSRSSKRLKNNLLNNDFPILFEGLHCCHLLNDEDLKSRFKIVRNHNIEHHYYSELAKIEINPVKRQYFKTEAKKLKRFEPIIKKANLCLSISETDLAYFKKNYPKVNSIFVPAFHSNSKVISKSGKGDYVLYHGNLSVSENVNAAKFIIEKLFKDINIPLKIAGLNPTKDLIDLIKNHPNLELIQNPNDEEMNDLITNAQINLLYTEQSTGLKLKLLNVLYNGRHCIVNPKMVEGTSLGKLCSIDQNSTELKKSIQHAFNLEFSLEEIDTRKILLSREYANETSFQKIIDEIKYVI
jgi:hypothetical protein